MRIGLECGARTLKVAWVATRRGRVEWHYAEQLRASDTSPETFHRELAQLLHPLRRSRVSAQLVLTAPEAHLCQFSVQLADAKHVPEAVREQLPKLLPFEVERAQVQFLVRSQQRAEGGVECRLLLAACDKGAVRPTLDALWALGWTPSSVIPAALALVETAKALKAIDQEPVVLMEMGERTTTIVLVDGGDAVYARDVTLGDDHLTEALMGRVSVGQATLALSREQAEAIKREVGIPDAATPAAIAHAQVPVATYLALVQPILEQLVSEVRRTMTFGAYTAMESTPTRVVISGEGSRLPNFAHWLSGQLGVPVVRLHCEKLLGEQGAAAAVTCGLALFERPPKLDLQPPVSRQRRSFMRITTRLWQALVVVIVMFWAGAAWWGVRQNDLRRELTALRARSVDLQPVATLQEAIATHAQLVQQLSRSQGLPLDWFRRLAQGFPKPVRLFKLSINVTRQVQMTGEAQGWDQSPEAQVSTLTLWLEQSQLCRKAQLAPTRRPSENSPTVEFSLTCEGLL